MTSDGGQHQPLDAGGPTASLTALPDTAVGRAALAEALTEEPASIAHHSLRSFLLARLLAVHLGVTHDGAYDEELLFVTCVLHDIGLAASTGGSQRFEVEGADRAATFLTGLGLPTEKVDAVWEAVALHTSFGIAERRGLLARLTRLGVGMDFGYDTDFVTDEEASLIHSVYPRLELERELVDAIVAQATSVPTRAPRYSMTAVLFGQRTAPPYLSQIEVAAQSSRWASSSPHR